MFLGGPGGAMLLRNILNYFNSEQDNTLFVMKNV